MTHSSCQCAGMINISCLTCKALGRLTNMSDEKVQMGSTLFTNSLNIPTSGGKVHDEPAAVSVIRSLVSRAVCVGDSPRNQPHSPNQTKPNPTQPNETKPNPTKPNPTKPNQTKPNQTQPTLPAMLNCFCKRFQALLLGSLEKGFDKYAYIVKWIVDMILSGKF